MKWTRRSIAAISVLGSMLLLTACHSTSGTSTQAASQEGGETAQSGSGEPQGSPETGQGPGTAPEPRAVTVPVGTLIDVRLDDSLSSSRDHRGDSFHATLDEPILVNGMVAVPQGAGVRGRVVAAEASGHLETPAELSVTLSALEIGRQECEIRTSNYSRRGQSHAKHDAKWIAGLAGGGALLGALIGRGKGAAIGAGVGGGAGTASAYATGRKDIYLPSETRMRFVLKEPVTLNITG